MALLITLLLAAPASKNRVPEVAEFIKAGDQAKALDLLKKIGKHKKNHEEAKALVKLVKKPKVRKQKDLVEGIFLALKGIGSRKVTRSLLALLDHSTMKKDPAVRIGVCRALGGSADPIAVDELIDLMRDKDDHVCAAAGEAAGAYRYDKESTRKNLFKTILGIYESNWNLKNSVDPDRKKERARAERKWEIIEQPFERSLQLLSNVTQNDPPSWRRWWNKTKHKKWAELEN
ncbi:MAG: HEAT repeat domain-containing protein [Planctomycetota bacterium]|jgi:HEAT repeat protein